MNKRSSIRATRIGGAAYRYLAARPRTGKVVSSFSGGINILFEGGEAFVPVQSSSVPLHPWAIEILGAPLRLPEGTPVSAEGGAISLGETHILFSAARIEELSLPQFSAEEAAIAQHNFPVLARFVEETRRTHPPDPFQAEIDAIIERWHETSDPAGLLDLMGLGAGSTPSGDDVLLGIIAGISIFEGVDGRARKTLSQLRPEVQEIARARTPLLSAQMLLAACDRSFPEPILALLKRLTFKGLSGNDLLKRANSVAHLGHHSGLAMLLGLTRFSHVPIILPA